jgi:hypothetical protein
MLTRIMSCARFLREVSNRVLARLSWTADRLQNALTRALLWLQAKVLHGGAEVDGADVKGKWGTAL